MLKNILLVGLGGCLGSMARYVLSNFIRTANFPLNTLLINITGSLVIGVVLGLSFRDGNFSNSWKLFLTTGICGGFTTFSAFSIENLQLLQSGKYLLCILYTGLSIIGGMGAAWLGFKLMSN